LKEAKNALLVAFHPICDAVNVVPYLAVLFATSFTGSLALATASFWKAREMDIADKLTAEPSTVELLISITPKYALTGAPARGGLGLSSTVLGKTALMAPCATVTFKPLLLTKTLVLVSRTSARKIPDRSGVNCSWYRPGLPKTGELVALRI
jgi:hypothetical protein